MEAFVEWLEFHKNSLKFVITSVPFLAEMVYEKNRIYMDQSRQDKWSGDRYDKQRKEILRTICEKGIQKTVFLVGDVHCSYHATLDIEPDIKSRKNGNYVGNQPQRVTLHELSCSPIYQVQLGNKEKVCIRISVCSRKSSWWLCLRLQVKNASN